MSVYFKSVVPNLGVRVQARASKMNLRGCEAINRKGTREEQISLLSFPLIV